MMGSYMWSAFYGGYIAFNEYGLKMDLSTCLPIYVLDIQGDSGGICNTLGNNNMCHSKQKNSYEHGSDFERLPRYGKKKTRTILRARTAIT